MNKPLIIAGPVSEEVTPFYRFVAEAGDEPASAELLIFDTIGNWEDIGEVSAKAFARDLAGLPSSVKRLDIHINSPGGSVSEAYGIYSRLADHRSDKMVYIDGLAASAASLIAMVGHKIFIRANANMMIHLPMALALGNADDMKKVIAALESVTESMINVYAKRTTLPRDEIRSLMAAETWFSPQDAVDQGFADEVRGVIKAAAIIDPAHAIFNGREFDLSRFHNVPAFSAKAETNKGSTMAKTNTKPTAQKKEGEEEPTPPPQTPAPETPPATPPPETPPASAPETKPETPPAAAQTEFERGVQVERQRVIALQKLDRPATHAIIAKAIADGKTVAEITAEAIDAMDNAMKQNARRTDASALNNIPPSDGADEPKSFGSLLTAKVKERQKARSRSRVVARN